MNLDDAEKLRAWMRANGILHAQVGDVSLTLAPEEPAPSTERPRFPTPKQYADPLDDPALYGLDKESDIPGLVEDEEASKSIVIE